MPLSYVPESIRVAKKPPRFRDSSLRYVRFCLQSGDELCEVPAVCQTGVGVGRLAEKRVRDGAGIHKCDAVAFDDLGDVGVSEKDQLAPQFLRAEGEGEKVRLHSVSVSVREEHPDPLLFEDEFLR